jgi:adenylate cyclase
MPDDDDRVKLTELLLGGQPVFTLADAAEKTGIPAKVVRRLWRSLGFALPSADEPAFNERDLAALELMQSGSRAGVIDVDTEVRLARALGQTMARLSDWQVSTLVSQVDEPDATQGTTGSRMSTALTIAESLDGTYEELLVYAWRRHVGASVSRLQAVGEMGEDPHTVTSTVGFADIVQFSALSNELDDNRIGDLVELFETRATDVVTSLGGRVIKTLGDSVLFVTENAVAGMDIAHGIIDVIGDDSRLPDVRLGLATGSVILRFGDVFGPPVNLAARLTAIARRNRVITDEATAARLPETRYETRALTARPVRGFGVLEPIAVRRL